MLLRVAVLTPRCPGAQRVIYHLLDQVAELMAGSAPRVEEEVVVGEAQVLQTFALKKGARCGHHKSSIPTARSLGFTRACTKQ